MIARLVTARHESGQTQRELAARLKRSHVFVAKYETCERRLDVIELMDVLKAIGTDPLDFLAVEAASKRPKRDPK